MELNGCLVDKLDYSSIGVYLQRPACPWTWHPSAERQLPASAAPPGRLYYCPTGEYRAPPYCGHKQTTVSVSGITTAKRKATGRVENREDHRGTELIGSQSICAETCYNIYSRSNNYTYVTTINIRTLLTSLSVGYSMYAQLLSMLIMPIKFNS